LLTDSAMPVFFPSPDQRPGPVDPEPGGGLPPGAGPGADEWGLALRLGVLTGEISPRLVDAVVDEAGCRERRRRLLPARAVVYFVLGLCLFSGADSAAPPGYRSVMRWLSQGLRAVHGPGLVSSSAMTKARQRVGAKALQLLFERLRGPLGGSRTPGVFAFGLRVLAWDGTALDVPDTPANAALFGRQKGAGNPQLRLLMLIECGTHAVIDAAFAGYTQLSEQKLARQVLASLKPGLLLLADRNFPGHDLWAAATATGADLLWRIKKTQIFEPITVLPDGSYISRMHTPADNLRLGYGRRVGRRIHPAEPGHIVRIIEYIVTVTSADGSSRTELFRLVTTLLDHHRAPATELADLYRQRWENENSYSEVKTRLRGAGFVLRSKSPELIEQELYAFLCVYQALGAFEIDAAHTAGIDPDRISFTVTIRTARAHISTQPAASPETLQQARRNAVTDLLADLLPPRRPRQVERIRKPPKNGTRTTKKHNHTRPDSHINYQIKIIQKQAPPGSTP
jgi:hypothetical protein